MSTTMDESSGTALAATVPNANASTASFPSDLLEPPEPVDFGAETGESPPKALQTSAMDVDEKDEKLIWEAQTPSGELTHTSSPNGTEEEGIVSDDEDRESTHAGVVRGGGSGAGHDQDPENLEDALALINQLRISLGVSEGIVRHLRADMKTERVRGTRAEAKLEGARDDAEYWRAEYREMQLERDTARRTVIDLRMKIQEIDDENEQRHSKRSRCSSATEARQDNRPRQSSQSECDPHAGQADTNSSREGDDVIMEDPAVRHEQTMTLPQPLGILPQMMRPVVRMPAGVYVAPPSTCAGYNSDERGFPKDVLTWHHTHKVQLIAPVFVYAMRCYYLWAYSRAVPPANRSEVQQCAVDKYQMPDWFAETITQTGRQKHTNQTLRAQLPSASRKSIGVGLTTFDKLLETFVSYVQFKEVPLCGLEFVDDAWTLPARRTRGGVLFEVLRMEPSKDRAGIELHQAQEVEQRILEVLIVPGSYRELVAKLQLSPAEDMRAMTYWPADPNYQPARQQSWNQALRLRPFVSPARDFGAHIRQENSGKAEISRPPAACSRQDFADFVRRQDISFASDGKIVLANGRFVPRMIQGRNLAERIDRWIGENIQQHQRQPQQQQRPPATQGFERDPPPHPVTTMTFASCAPVQTLAFGKIPIEHANKENDPDVQVMLERGKRKAGDPPEVVMTKRLAAKGPSKPGPGRDSAPEASTSKIPAPPVAGPSAPKSHLPPAFKYQSQMEDPAMVEAVIKRTLDAQITISGRELLAISPEIRKHYREGTVTKRIPTVETSLFEVEEGLPEEEAMVMNYYDKGYVVSTHLLTASPIDSLRVLDMLVNDTMTIACTLDQGSEIVAMNRNIWQDLGVTLSPEKTLTMESADSNQTVTAGVIENLKFTVGDIDLLIQVHVVDGAPFDILMGRPFFRFTECHTQDRSNGTQELTLTCPNTGKRITVPTRRKPAQQENVAETMPFHTSPINEEVFA
ncbi:hypothetical protein B0H11DRAFT_2215798 [Mycena galericulata]|nr:hypothetical protein B0H11DRAFT_2215798 [Mycena galericulata]